MNEQSQTPAPSAPKTIIPFNLNNYIYVRLTPAGKAWHAAQWAMMNAHGGYTSKVPNGDPRTHKMRFVPPYEPPFENKDGLSRWQAWQFMEVFGDAMFHGNPEPVCDMNILLDFRAP
jgi:hypothetical protein